MLRVYVGAALIIAGIAALIEAQANRPGYAKLRPEVPRPEVASRVPPAHIGLSHTAYDLIRIGAWALVIFGGLIVVVWLIRLLLVWLGYVHSQS